MMETIQTDLAPRAVGPYSQAVRSQGFIFLSGQISLDPKTGDVVGTDIESQSRQVLSNIRAVVEASGRKMTDVVRTGVFLTDMADFPKFNSIYESFFGTHRPARTTIQAAALPKGVKLEMDAVVADGNEGEKS